MVVKIRLSRFGKRHQPLYNIVVSQARSARDSRPLEVLGTYDPTPRVPLASNLPPPLSSSTTAATSSTATQNRTEQATEAAAEQEPAKPKRYKDIRLDTSRTKYWLGVGAQPSEPVWKLLALIGLMEPKPGTTKGPRIG